MLKIYNYKYTSFEIVCFFTTKFLRAVVWFFSKILPCYSYFLSEYKKGLRLIT